MSISRDIVGGAEYDPGTDTGIPYKVEEDSASIAAIRDVTPAADTFAYFTGASTAAVTAITAVGRSFLAAVNAAAQRIALGLGSAATYDTGTSGNKVALTNGANDWGAVQAFSFGFTVAAGQTALLGYSTAVSTGGITPSWQFHGLNQSQATTATVRWSNDTGGAFFSLYKSRGTTPGSYTTLITGDNIGTFGFAGSNGTSLVSAGSFVWDCDGAPTASGVPSRARLRTHDGTSGRDRFMFDSTGFYVYNASGTQRFYLDNTGNQTISGTFGAGIASGGAKLHASVDGTVPSVTMLPGGESISSTANAANIHRFVTASATAVASPNLIWMRSRGTINAPTAAISGDRVGAITAQIHDGTGRATGAILLFNIDGTVSLGVAPTTMTLQLANAAGALTERIRADKDGNVGFSTAQFGSGSLVLGIADATTAPTTNPTGGGVLYSDAGAGKWRTSAGNVVTFAPSTVPNITGSRGGNAALASLLTELANLGLITDSST